MQEYDVALKLLLQGRASLTIRELTGTAIAKWLDVELPSCKISGWTFSARRSMAT